MFGFYPKETASYRFRWFFVYTEPAEVVGLRNMFLRIKKLFSKAREFYFRHERFLLILSFFVGVLWDNLTLQRIDLLYENIVFGWNIFLTIFYIILINAYDAGRLQKAIFKKIIPFVPLLLQFSFGNLFSGFIIFYTRSSSVFVSWPFILMLLSLFLGNEFFRGKYIRLTFQVSILFVALFSYAVFILPILLSKMGASIFLLSGVAALLLLALIILVMFLIIPERVKMNFKSLVCSAGAIYIIFHIFYFTNIIPPIPLSIKESGIYHSIERVYQKDHIYKVTFEPAPAYLFFKDQSDTFHWIPGTPIYSYSTIFSPTNLNVTIFHRWSYFEEEEGDWNEVARISYPVIGGRDGGYRGYSYLQNIKPGKWKVDVITERNQVLGSRTFKVVEVDVLTDIKTDFR